MGKGRRHEWRERTAEGEARIVRAWIHGGVWRMQHTTKSDPNWHDLDPIPPDDLRSLRQKLWEKYQRNRVPHKQIELVDDLLEELEEEG